MVTKAEKYRRDAEIYGAQAKVYAKARSKWGQEQFVKYTRMADQCLAKAEAYERQDTSAIERIEADNANVNRVLE